MWRTRVAFVGAAMLIVVVGGTLYGLGVIGGRAKPSACT
jgi:hypothetical protein